MANIFARSPYIITVDEVDQEGSKIELFLWNGTGSAPSTPQYTLSKLGSSNIYDVSAYIREYLSFATRQDPTIITALNTSQWCNVKIKRYSTYTLLDTTTYTCFDGYTYYESGSNYNLGNYLLDQKEYYYNGSTYAGEVWAYLLNTYVVKYTVGAFYSSTTISANGLYTLPRIKTFFDPIADGYLTSNKLEILTSTGTVLATWTFTPVCEPKYTPVVIDFINKYGAWQREFFFKASKNTLEIQSSDYNVMQSSVSNYSTFQGQKRSFNTNAKESISVNSGYVSEDFKDNIKQLLMSEKILVDNKPAICKTKSLEVMKSINNHMINYNIEFEFAYNTINNVI
jgi:hypothetical protein